jgi:hypothetical protein
VTLRPRPLVLAALSLAAVAAAAGCGGGGSGTATPTIPPARTYELARVQPSGALPAAKPVDFSFTIRQPSGAPLTKFKTGSGPHTGVHLIFVRSDLGYIVHKHPPVAADGRISEKLTFPAPGRYRMIVDTYPNQPGTPPNFQLFKWIAVKGKAKPIKLPPFSPKVTVDGYHFTLQGNPRLKAIRPAFMTITVKGPDGKAAKSTPWFGALAHAIFMHTGNLDYFHTHVCSPGASGCTSVLGGARVTGRSSTPGKLTVGVLVPEPGVWRLFLQTRVNGKILTAPFTLHVAA